MSKRKTEAEEWCPKRGWGRGHKSPIPQKERDRLARDKWRAKNPAYYRTIQLRKCYDISPEDYAYLLRECGGLCLVCRRPETAKDPRSGKTRELGVDHDHTSGMVRGLLCSACNTALGMLGDDPLRIRALATYVESYV